MRNFFSVIVDLFSAPSFSSSDSMSSSDSFGTSTLWNDTDSSSSFDSMHSHATLDDGINPATGFPMTGALDVAGNTYGSDSGLFSHADSSDTTILHHHWHDTNSGFDQHASDAYSHHDAFAHHDSFSHHDTFSHHDSFGSSFGSSWD